MGQRPARPRALEDRKPDRAQSPDRAQPDRAADLRHQFPVGPEVDPAGAQRFRGDVVVRPDGMLAAVAGALVGLVMLPIFALALIVVPAATATVVQLSGCEEG